MSAALPSSHLLPQGATAPTRRLFSIAQRLGAGLSALAPALDLLIRVIVASVFFKAGLVKVMSWDSTVSLFENVYEVPLLPPDIAALLGTSVELVFPVLLVLGLGSRLSAFVLFVFNIVAVVSYPDLGEVGLKDHQTWGLLLLMPLLHGPGRLSLDHLIGRRLTAPLR